ncbi:MAG: YncE family protein, partial [Bacteroidales bacterium]|nr:YncE family protein [Bacteroidales bacterium]
MRIRQYLLVNFVILVEVLSVISCRKDDPIVSSTSTFVGGMDSGEIKGMYLLNEGNMGSNKCTLDYYDYKSGYYTKNIYPERNPNVVKELGDVGNDIQIYRDKIWAVINCSHFVEVMDSRSAKHISQISIPNCRYIVFDGDYAYVSSYAGPVQIDPNSRLGYVAKIDVNTLKIVAECTVGYQPEEMVIYGGKLYVANSGGYRVPNYDNTVSVIDLESFKEEKKIEVAINLHRMELDDYGNIWVSSRGDYYAVDSNVYIIDTKTDSVVDCLDIPCSELTYSNGRMYICSSQWSYSLNESSVSYCLVDTKSREVLTNNFITDGT